MNVCGCSAHDALCCARPPSACAPTAARPAAGSLPCGRKVARPPTAAQARSARSASLSCPLGRARYSRPWTSDAGAGAYIVLAGLDTWRSANSRTGGPLCCGVCVAFSAPVSILRPTSRASRAQGARADLSLAQTLLAHLWWAGSRPSASPAFGLLVQPCLCSRARSIGIAQ